MFFPFPLRFLIVCTLTLVGPLPSVATAQASIGCDESCLGGIMSRYLDALGRHAPADAPLASNVIATENEQFVAPGDGLWKTISGLGQYRHIFADAQAGSVAAFFALKEQGVGALAMVRLQVIDRHITEAETIIARGEGTHAFLKSEHGPVKPIFDEKLSPDERPSRSELIHITDGYFNAIEQGRSSLAHFHNDCDRVENGIQTTNNPALGMDLGGHKPDPKDLTCAGQIDSGVFSYITEISPRRYLLVDESRGLVFGVFMFRHAGRLTQITRPDGSVIEMPAAAKRPFNVVVSELFKIEGGRLREIEAVMTELPYRSRTPWRGTLDQ